MFNRLGTTLVRTLRTILRAPDLSAQANNGEAPFQPTGDDIRDQLVYDHRFVNDEVEELYRLGDNLDYWSGLSIELRHQYAFEALRLAGDAVAGDLFRGDSVGARQRLATINGESGYVKLVKALAEIGVPTPGSYTIEHVDAAVRLLTDHAVLVKQYLTSQGRLFLVPVTE